MANAKDIRRRIKTVKNIQQITQAMKLVASARLQKAQQRVQAARPYAHHIQQIIADLSASGTSVDHPLLSVREVKKRGVIIIGADRGLAGSFHSNVIRTAQKYLHGMSPDSVRLFVMGKKCLSSVRRLGFPIEEELVLPGLDVDFLTVRPLSKKVQAMFAAGELDEVDVITTEFKSAIAQKTIIHRLLPVETEVGEDTEAIINDFIFEPQPAELLAQLFSRYVDTQLFRAVLESIASEQGARMTAMTSATANAGELIERLTLSLNRARQAAITQEIAEIVAGADALK